MSLATFLRRARIRRLRRRYERAILTACAVLEIAGELGAADEFVRDARISLQGVTFWRVTITRP